MLYLWTCFLAHGPKWPKNVFDWSADFSEFVFEMVTEIGTFCEYYSLYKVENFFGVQACIVTSQRIDKY